MMTTCGAPGDGRAARADRRRTTAAPPASTPASAHPARLSIAPLRCGTYALGRTRVRQVAAALGLRRHSARADPARVACRGAVHPRALLRVLRVLRPCGRGLGPGGGGNPPGPGGGVLGGRARRRPLGGGRPGGPNPRGAAPLAARALLGPVPRARAPARPA